MLACPVASCCKSYLDLMCIECCGSLPTEQAVESELPLLYKKTLLSDPEHPVVAAKKAAKEQRKTEAKRKKHSEAYQAKSRLGKRAFKNEQQTRREVIRATQRSGALNGDGDSRIGNGQWGIDDKYMSQAHRQFTVSVEDIDKAHRQQSIIVITLANGRKFAIATLEDFCSCAASLAALTESTSK